MALTLGIVGLPNVGKSTLFNALTKNSVLAANYPFATIEPNVGVVPLPDSRLKVLAEIFSSEKVIPATVSEADAICQVIRVFADDDVVHVEGKVSPHGDIETINTELILADLQTLERAVPRLEKEIKGKKIDKAVLESALAAQQVLEAGDTLFARGDAAGVDPVLIKDLGLMTTKPFLYVFNVDEDQLTDQALQGDLAALVAPADAIILNAKLESDLADLDAGEAAELLESVGVAGSMAKARAAGKVRMEGKDYVMAEGDVVEFRSGLQSGGKK